jgi:hypothetical protein
LAVGVLGCGKSEAPAGKAVLAVTPAAHATRQAAVDGPAAAAAQFLEAVRTGNDAQTNHMLSATARTKLAQLGGGSGLTPRASDTARYTVGEVEYVTKDGARVACTWTDLDEAGHPKTNHQLWVLRHESEGWRVVGVAWTVFEGEPPLLLNFEDPEDIVKKEQWWQAEVARRGQEEKNRENAAEKPPETLPR